MEKCTVKSIYFIDQVPGEQVREPEQSQNNYNLLKKIAAFTIIEKWSPADFFFLKNRCKQLQII